jgi:hypothetical protein
VRRTDQHSPHRCTAGERRTPAVLSAKRGARGLTPRFARCPGAPAAGPAGRSSACPQVRKDLRSVATDGRTAISVSPSAASLRPPSSTRCSPSHRPRHRRPRPRPEPQPRSPPQPQRSAQTIATIEAPFPPAVVGTRRTRPAGFGGQPPGCNRIQAEGGSRRRRGCRQEVDDRASAEQWRS